MKKISSKAKMGEKLARLVGGLAVLEQAGEKLLHDADLTNVYQIEIQLIDKKTGKVVGEK